MSDERPGAQTPMTEDDRFAIASRAAAAERANQPRWMIVVATILLLAALLYLATSFNARRVAEKARRAEAGQVRLVKRLLAEIETLENASPRDDASVPIGEPMPNLRSQLEGVARRAGLTDQLPVPSDRVQQSFESVQSVKYDYTIQDPQIDAILRFVEMAQDEIPALGVHTLDLRAERTRWRANISFLRWERVP